MTLKVLEFFTKPIHVCLPFVENAVYFCSNRTTPKWNAYRLILFSCDCYWLSRPASMYWTNSHFSKYYEGFEFDGFDIHVYKLPNFPNIYFKCGFSASLDRIFIGLLLKLYFGFYSNKDSLYRKPCLTTFKMIDIIEYRFFLAFVCSL